MATSDRLYAAIGAAVRAARERAGLTQEELGRRVGLTRTSITNIERGRQQIQVHTLYALAEALEVAVAGLLPPAEVPDAAALEDRLPRDLAAGERDWVRRILATAPGER